MSRFASIVELEHMRSSGASYPEIHERMSYHVKRALPSPLMDDDHPRDLQIYVAERAAEIQALSEFLMTC